MLTPAKAALSVSAIGNPWQQAGKRYDEESGLLAFGQRYYDPKLGRQITQDPEGFDDGPNRYAYVHNNPLLYYDPYGLSSEVGFFQRPFFQNMWSRSPGICHGAVDFWLDNLFTYSNLLARLGAQG